MRIRAVVLCAAVMAIPLAPGCTCSSQPGPYCPGPFCPPDALVVDSPIPDGASIDLALGPDGGIVPADAPTDLPPAPDAGIPTPDGAPADALCSGTGCPAGTACTTAGCEPILCAPGSVTCAGNSIAACNGTGTAQAVAPCATGTICVAAGGGAACAPMSCAPGASRCMGATLHTCNASGTGEIATDCSASTQACVTAGGTSSCRPIVCAPGSSSCAGSLLAQCDPTGTTPTVTDCSKTAGDTCNPAPAPASCGPPACAGAPSYCAGNVVTYCGSTSMPVDCAKLGQICAAQAGMPGVACQPPVCAAGSTQCTGNTLVTCDARGSSQTRTDCTASMEVCVPSGSGASCQPALCAPGAVFCSGSSVVTCSATGTGETASPCPGGQTCVASSGGASCRTQVCTPGTTSCAGSTLVTCNATGTGTISSDCAAGGGRCVTSGGGATCVANVCVPGAEICNGTRLETCRSDGSGYDTVDCAAGGAYDSCASLGGGTAACQAIVCVPELASCMGSVLTTCNPYGTGERALDCSAGGYACVTSPPAASCQPIVCTPGATMCSGSSLDTCNSSGTAYVGTDCSGVGACTTSGSGSSCTSAPCTPGAVRCGGDGVSVYRCNASGSGSTLIARCDGSIGGACDAAGDCVTSCAAAARSSTNAGCEFWPTHLWNTAVEAFGDAATFGVAVANPAPSQAATVTLADNHGLSQTQTIPPLGTVTFAIPGTTDELTRTEWSNKALHLTSTIPVEAYQFNALSASGIHSGGASLLLPAPSLTAHYFAMVYPYSSLTGGSPPTGAGYVAIVGTHDGTTVTVTVAAPTVASPDGRVPALPAGGKRSFTIDRFDTLEIGTDDVDGLDMTGTEVLASTPVVVFGGSGTSTLPAGDYGGDHLEAQMFPIEIWDSSYFIAKTQPRDGEKDYYRVLAQQAGTIVAASDPSITFPVLGAGQFADFSTNEALRIDASHPILVHHYIPAWGNNSGTHDPSVYGVPPINGCLAPGGWYGPNDTQCIGDANMYPAIPYRQFRSDYMVYTPSSYAWDFIDVIAPAGATVTLDGSPIPALTLFAGGSFGYARIQVDDGGGAHTLLGDRSFGVEVYGYDSYVSYSYPGGLDLVPLPSQ